MSKLKLSEVVLTICIIMILVVALLFLTMAYNISGAAIQQSFIDTLSWNFHK